MAELRMPDINSVIIVGNLIKDPTFRSTTTGTPVANFMIASNRKFKDSSGQIKEDVCFIGVVAWYKLAESCNENLKKGSAVLVEGELQSRSWKTENGFNRNIVEIKARRIQFLNRRETTGPQAEAPEEPEQTPKKDEEGEPPTEETPPDTEEPPPNDDKPDPDKGQAPENRKPDSTEYDFGYRDLKI
jgi:single-strand DNA-binding protein